MGAPDWTNHAQIDPTKRATAQECLKHPFLALGHRAKPAQPTRSQQRTPHNPSARSSSPSRHGGTTASAKTVSHKAQEKKSSSSNSGIEWSSNCKDIGWKGSSDDDDEDEDEALDDAVDDGPSLADLSLNSPDPAAGTGAKGAKGGKRPNGWGGNGGGQGTAAGPSNRIADRKDSFMREGGGASSNEDDTEEISLDDDDGDEDDVDNDDGGDDDEDRDDSRGGMGRQQQAKTSYFDSK